MYINNDKLQQIANPIHFQDMYIPMQAHINVGFFFMSGLIKFQVVLKLEFDLIHKYHMLLNYLSLLKLELDLVYIHHMYNVKTNIRFF
jgi:hypothetical protein